MNQRILHFTSVLPILATLPLFGFLAQAAADQPNLIVIMTDDMGYADVGFNGCKDIPTPNIDSIAADGVKFDSGYVAYSVCGPSRASFITGRYGQRFGFERNPQYQPADDQMGLPLTETTLASTLKQVGYHCGIVGKWHLGATKKLHPLNRGFNEFYGHLGGGHRYFVDDLTIEDSYSAKDEAESYRTWIMKNHTPVKPRKYLTDDFSDEAVSFVNRNHDKPFFLYLSYNAPHAPLQASDKYLDRFPDIKDKKRRTYAAMVSAVDDGVGRVLKALRENKIEQNTIVFFLSDNGGIPAKNAADNGSLRGHKGDPWEGGFRVPFAARWPDGFPRGITYHHPVSSLDIFATITSLAKAGIPSERPLDGVNLTPFVNGKRTDAPHVGIFLRKFDQGIWAVRSGDHKLVVFEKTGFQSLHNLKDDISETTNILPNNPDEQKRLTGLWKNWNKPNIEPKFAGLIMKKSARKNKKSDKTRANDHSPEDPGQKTAEYWKNQFFKKHPDADSNKDGELSWSELKAAKERLGIEKGGTKKTGKKNH